MTPKAKQYAIIIAFGIASRLALTKYLEIWEQSQEGEKVLGGKSSDLFYSYTLRLKLPSPRCYNMKKGNSCSY